MSARQPVYDIPEFHSKQDTLDWANKVKWVEPLRRQLQGRVERYGRLYDMERDFKLMNYYYHQWEYGKLALRIIDNYKRLGIVGDVGAEIYIGEQPL